MSDEIPRVLQLLWGVHDPNRPGPKPGLSINEIGDAAVRIADADGLAAVSMSKVAAELGRTTMSLYRYVDAKQDLYAVMLDRAFGLPELEPADDWQGRIRAWAHAFRARLQEHPWILQVPVDEPPLAPQQLVWMEQGLNAFDGTSLSPGQRLSSVLLIDIYVRGAIVLTPNFGAPAEPAAAADERDRQQADRLYARRLAALADPKRFPSLTAALESGALDGDEDEFTAGLDTVIAGIEAKLQAG
ncbi:TetR/AcrR family transcriptional regulator [Kribbella deserti]|uniref:TetR/AcrR family transcriptional regulator n=1 Tax=Kribbella deserti TaxID=1926257 RepID=A0ABV6QWA5_9ACTN